MALEDSFEKVLNRHAEIESLLNSGEAANDPKEFANLSREYAEIGKVVDEIRRYMELMTTIRDSEEMINDPETDAELKSLAQEELREAESAMEEQERIVQIALLPKDAADERSAILEIRAGTGGDEAGLFAADLYRMYQRYAALHGWTMENLDSNETGVGGFKEVSAQINGAGVFAKLKYESGVHRVQRVPTTESGGRIHTSAATVAILPVAEEVDVEINPADLRIDVFRASGAGGQHVNTTDSAVRITHIPSGVVVEQQSERSQHKNKAKAMQVLRARIYEAERLKAAQERSDARKNQVGSGDRSERIRTYNFPDGRVTDHRINLTLYKLDRILEGELDEFVDALTAEDQARQLAGMVS
ncbi:MAG: peptide chain release factor 1 [Alphaproteobacteria bacterium]